MAERLANRVSERVSGGASDGGMCQYCGPLDGGMRLAKVVLFVRAKVKGVLLRIGVISKSGPINGIFTPAWKHPC